MLALTLLTLRRYANSPLISSSMLLKPLSTLYNDVRAFGITDHRPQVGHQTSPWLLLEAHTLMDSPNPQLKRQSLLEISPYSRARSLHSRSRPQRKLWHFAEVTPTASFSHTWFDWCPCSLPREEGRMAGDSAGWKVLLPGVVAALR